MFRPCVSLYTYVRLLFFFKFALNMGASMVKWTKKVLWYTKTLFVLVKGLKVVAKHCLNWIFPHDNLCCCVEYSNLENQDEIFNNYQ